MERPVEENRSGLWKILLVPTFILTALLLMTAILTRDWIFALTALALPALFFVSKKRDDKTVRRQNRSWLITDAGLVRIYGVSGQRETISWPSIRSMRWVSFGGLIVQWEESGQRSAEFKREFREETYAGIFRANLRLHKQEADAIAELWLKHRSDAAPVESAQKKRSKLNASAKRAVAMCAGLGLLLIGWAVYDIMRDLPSRSWPATDGKIVRQQIEDIAPTSKHPEARAKVFLYYDYTVDGRNYESDRYAVWRTTFSGSKEEALQYAAQSPRGSSVAVYYNPAHPEQAALVKGPDWDGNSGFLLLGAFFIGFSWFSKWIMLRQAPGRPEKREENFLCKDYGR